MSSHIMKTQKRKGLTVNVLVDEDGDNPTDSDGWKVYSFCTRHNSFKHPSELGLEGRDASGKHHVSNPGIRQKLKVGLAFFLSYYEHGLCHWSIQGTRRYPDMQWDGVSTAGIVIWEQPPDHIGAKTYKDRQKDAEAFMETYTAWSNGECYRFVVMKPCGSCGKDEEKLESGAGFYNVDDAMKAGIEEADSIAKQESGKK